MFKYEDIRMIQIELTSLCQASCPMCMRNVYGGIKNPHLVLDSWSISDFKKIVSTEVLQKVTYMLFCGQYGEPLINKDIVEIVQYITKTNPNLHLHINTNGSLYNEEWWKNFASILPSQHSIHFGIDGIDNETHIKYRIGTNYNKIINNMKAFIENGGNAVWEFIRFKHNEHQVDLAQKLSIQIGCKSFVVKDTSRFIDNKPYPVMNKDSDILYYLEPATNTQSGFVTKEVVDNYEEILKITKVDCYSLEYKRIYIDAYKRLFPCGPHGTTINPVPKYGDIVDRLRALAVEETQEIFKLIDNDLTTRTIKDIVDSKEWQEVWSDYANNQKKCITCSKNCGVFNFNLTKFCDEEIKI